MKEATKKYLEEIVKNSYQETAFEFNLTRQKVIWPQLQKKADAVPDNSKILDLGCGNARLLKAFNNRKIDYLGCDQEKQLIEIARKNWPSHKFELCNFDEMPEEKFDYIFAIAVIHHIPSKEKRLEVLKKMKSRLNTNGKIIISVWNLRKSKTLLIFKTYFKQLFKKPVEFGDVLFPWKKDQGKNLVTRYYHAFSKKSLKNLAKSAGFKIESLEEDKYNLWIELKKD